MRSAFPPGVPERWAPGPLDLGSRSRLGLEFPERGRPGPGRSRAPRSGAASPPRGPPRAGWLGSTEPRVGEEGDRGHPRPLPSPRAAAPPTCSVFSAAITTCSGSRAGPGSPPPPGGHLSPQRRAAAAAARARAERDAPPCRRPASPLGGLHARAAALRRPGAPPPAAALLTRPLARPPRAAAAAACRVPPLRSLAFLRRCWSGAWQTSTCCWRTPRTETGNPEPGGKPGRRGEG